MKKNKFYRTYSHAVHEYKVGRTVIFFSQHFNYNSTDICGTHVHGFWQLECVIKGELAVMDCKGEKIFRGGASLIIPPGVIHGFRYISSEYEICSVKFTSDIIHPRGEEKTPLSLSEILSFSNDGEAGEIIEKIIKEVVEGQSGKVNSLLLSAYVGILMELCLSDIEIQENETSSLVEKIKLLVENSRGNRISVKEIAEKLQMSRNTVSKMFKKKTGMSLKDYIDIRRAETACEILSKKDPSLSVSEVAEIMNFPDIYTFSKFFSRLTGISPVEYKALSGEEKFFSSFHIKKEN